nr:unnamed protein product [Spirometra erinaceieuropaei]
MHIGVFLHLLVAGFTFFELGYGQSFCNWSRRIIPGGATGNLTVEVPLYYSYRSGYINNVPFGTYPWARGWCTYKQDYFRCSYGERMLQILLEYFLRRFDINAKVLPPKDWTRTCVNQPTATIGAAKWDSLSSPVHLTGFSDILLFGIQQRGDDIYTTIITLPKVETISYVRLQDSHPITLHRAGDKSVPGFYVKKSDRLDICSQYYTITLQWHFNGNESDLQNVSCYTNGRLFCSGLQPFELKQSEKCGFRPVAGGIRIGYVFYKPRRRFGYYYCYADKDLTKALTYIVDWNNATRTRDASVLAKSIGNIPKASPITTSGTELILCKISLVWTLLISAMNCAPT